MWPHALVDSDHLAVRRCDQGFLRYAVEVVAANGSGPEKRETMTLENGRWQLSVAFSKSLYPSKRDIGSR